ncbi:MAG: acylase [Acidobacteria bacterium]|nr:MAG: acylase [Acidobacteriota bacterium]
MKRTFLPTVVCWLILLSCFGQTGLGQNAKPKYPLPDPKYKVRLEPSHMVPMRDGVRLSTDLYFPEGASGRLPVILIRTPYNKNGYRRDKSSTYIFAGQGYIVAVQDVRARYESEGREYIVSAADTQDGSDAIDWLAAQPWSSGKVGTFGCSYSGENQMDTAKLKNPHLRAMIPQAGGGAYRFAGLIQGGVIELAGASGWFIRNGSKIRPALPVDVPPDQFVLAARYFNLAPVVPEIDFRTLWRTLPTINMVKSTGVPPTDWEGFISHGPADSWWDQFGYVKDSHHFDVPALYVDSWYDYGPADTLGLLNLLKRNSDSARARENQFAIIAPVTHCQYDKCYEQTIVGKRDLGDTQFDFYGTYIGWFDFWLKGIDNGITRRPKIQLYVMGKNQWRGEEEWPLVGTQFTKYYLHSDGKANSRFGTGLLSAAAPTEETSDHYTYDPQSPVPTIGGPDLGGGAADLTVGGQDQSDVETRQDVLVYTTPALEHGLEVTGPLQVVLYVSSSVDDTDFTAKLVDVYPDGKAYNIHEGILRARYREGYDKNVLMKKGETYEVKIDLQATSNYFGPGHRIRLEVASSNFPRFERNLNTGGNNYDETQWKVAENVVHHSKNHGSYLLLPVIP